MGPFAAQSAESAAPRGSSPVSVSLRLLSAFCFGFLAQLSLGAG